MRKAAFAAAVFLAFPLVISGCRKAQTEQTIAAPVADGMETESVSEEQIEEEKIASVIDTAIPIMPGARIAVVSKATKGEFWDLVFEGMEQAVEDVNEAYEFSGDQKVTITVEGPDEEQMVEEQINTLDAVIAENPAAVCISVGDMNSSQAQLESARENGIPVVVFDSNVYETDLITAFRATDNGQVGRMAGYHLAEAIGKSGNVAVFSDGGAAAEDGTHVDHATLPDCGADIQDCAHHNDRIIAYLHAVADDRSRLHSGADVFQIEHRNGRITGMVLHMQRGDSFRLRGKLRRENLPVAEQNLQTVAAGKYLRIRKGAGLFFLQCDAHRRFFLRAADHFNDFLRFHTSAPQRIERFGRIISRQSRSPRCRPRISISAEARLVAMGTLYVSHR